MSVVLVAASIAAGVVHLAQGPEHVDELGWLGAGFYVAGLLQLAWAALNLLAARTQPVRGAGHRLGARRLLTPAGLAVNAGVLVAWLISRTIGLPAGDHPWTPEAVGMSDTITAVLEGGLLIALGLSLRRHPDQEPASATAPSGGVPSLVGAAPVLALILVAAIAALGAPHGHADADAHDAGAATKNVTPHGH